MDMNLHSARFPSMVGPVALGLGLWLAATLTTEARIDETQPQIEKRLLADGTAVRLLKSLAATEADVAAEAAGVAAEGDDNSDPGSGGGRNSKGGRNSGRPPGARSGAAYSPRAIDTLLLEASGQTSSTPGSRSPELPEYIYFKTDDGSQAKTKLQKANELTGWELHIYLYKQISVLEVYHRVGRTLTDPEVNAILEANHGTVSWNRSSASATTNFYGIDDFTSLSFIGYEYERGDGVVRAFRAGNDLVIFSAGLDKHLIELKKKLLQADNSRNSKTAGGSVRGF